MRGMNSASVDLIYLDPPFNSNANYAAPIGSVAAGAEFKDTWGLDDLKIAWHGLIKSEHPALYKYLAAVKDIHSPSMMAYLIYMVVRLMEMKRLLKSTGSIYLHCDPTASHYLKILMDNIFGRRNFRNEIVWAYPASPSASTKDFPRKHDTIFRYVVGGEFKFNADAVRIPYSESSINRIKYSANASKVMAGTKIKLRDGGKIPPSTWSDIQQVYRYRSERTGYPTQKPIELLRRIIKSSSDSDDMILDPFCGCATTCIAAEELQRQWVGIDIGEKAADLVQMRMKENLGMLYDGSHRTDIPTRNDLAGIRRYNHPENKERLYGKQGGHCNACREHFQMRHLEIDHIQPQSRGGSDHISNLQLLCGSCNRIKGDRTQEYLMAVLNDKDIVKLAA